MLLQCLKWSLSFLGRPIFKIKMQECSTWCQVNALTYRSHSWQEKLEPIYGRLRYGTDMFWCRKKVFKKYKNYLPSLRSDLVIKEPIQPWYEWISEEKCETTEGLLNIRYNLVLHFFDEKDDISRSDRVVKINQIEERLEEIGIKFTCR